METSINLLESGPGLGNRLSVSTPNGAIKTITLSTTATGGNAGRSRLSRSPNSTSSAAANSNNNNNNGRRKRPTLSAREKNVRRIESNERERLRMHGLNEAFQVGQMQVHNNNHNGKHMG